jgi:hypothetical protein
MAGIVIVANNIDAEAAFKIAGKVARRLEFATHRIDDWEWEATKGSLVASIFLGAFIAYCDFRIWVEEERDRSVAISIERNCPWWSGIIGVNRVKNQAAALADAIEEALEKDGGEVLERTAL